MERDGVTTKVASLHKALYRELKERLRLSPAAAPAPNHRYPNDAAVFIPPKDYGARLHRPS